MVEPGRELFVYMDGGEMFIVSRVRRAMNDIRKNDVSEVGDGIDNLIAAMFASAHTLDDVKDRARYTIHQLQIMLKNIESQNANDV